MAYPTQLNNQYKAEKAAGITSAKSFPEWHKAYQLNQQAVEAANAEPEVNLEVVTTPLTEEQLDDLTAFLETTEEVVHAPLVLNTTVELELHKLVLKPAEQPAEVTTPISKAAHARQIYDQMEQAATANKLALVRKDVINRFVLELPISKVGASTYLQNIKIKKGLVVSK